jgi:hypothetical protein
VTGTSARTMPNLALTAFSRKSGLSESHRLKFAPEMIGSLQIVTTNVI